MYSLCPSLRFCPPLTQLNPRKAVGPDCIPDWLLREYAEVLVEPVTAIVQLLYSYFVVSTHVGCFEDH